MRASTSSAKNTNCRVCGTAVYPADPQLNLDGKLFHKACGKCSQCQCQCSVGDCHVFEGEGEKLTLYCGVHYLRHFTETGGSYLGGSSFTRKSERDGQADALLDLARSPSYRSVDGLRVSDIPDGLSYEAFSSSFNIALQQASNASSIQQHQNAGHLLEGAADIESRRKQLASAYEHQPASSSVSTSSLLSTDFAHSAPVEARRLSYVSGSGGSAVATSSLPLPLPLPPPPPASPLAPVLGFFAANSFLSGTGAQFTGSFGQQAMLMEGKMCIVRLANGSLYEGEMHKSKFHGHGRLVSTHGHSFEGEWLEGKMHGRGKYTTFDGRVLEGEFSHDVFVGGG